LRYPFSLAAPETAGLLAAFTQRVKTGYFDGLTGGTGPGNLLLGFFERHFPFMAIDTLEMTGGNFKMASLDPQTFAVKEGIGHFLPGGGQYPLEGRPGDIHLFGALLLLEAFQVFQAESFQFFYRYTDRFQFSKGNACWLEVTGFREKAYPPAFGRPGHTTSPNIMDIRS